MEILNKRKIFYTISVILSVVSIGWLTVFRLPMGIDFAGGTLWEWQFSENREIDPLKTQLGELNLRNIQIYQTGEPNTVVIKYAETNQEIDQKVKGKLQGIGEGREIRRESVGPTISKSFQNRGVAAIILASAAIIFYIAWAFRRVSKPANPWLFGLAAVVALIHDLLISLGIFAILATIFHWQVDSLIIVAALTIMGFSVHDTIVVFDRTRENLRRYPWLPYEQVINDSLVQTLSRSLNTSLTLILVLLSMLFFGGESIRHFIAILLIGTVCGTYSSIFVASALLVTLSRKK